MFIRRFSKSVFSPNYPASFSPHPRQSNEKKILTDCRTRCMSGLNFHLETLYSRTDNIGNVTGALIGNVASLDSCVATISQNVDDNDNRITVNEKFIANLVKQTADVVDDIGIVRNAAQITTTLLENNAAQIETAIEYVYGEGALKLNAVQVVSVLNRNVLFTDTDIWNQSKDGKNRLLFETNGRTVIPSLSTETIELNGVNIFPYTRNATDLITGVVHSNLMPKSMNVDFINVDTLYVDKLRGDLGFNINLEETMYDSTAVIDGDFECDVLVTGGDFTFIQPITLLPGTVDDPGFKFTSPYGTKYGVCVDDDRGMVIINNDTQIDVPNIIQFGQFSNLEHKVELYKTVLDNDLSNLSNTVDENKFNVDSNVSAVETNLALYALTTNANIKSVTDRVTLIKTQTDSNIKVLNDEIDIYMASTNANIRALETNVVASGSNINSNLGVINSKIEAYKSILDTNIQILDTKVNTTKTMTNNNVDTVKTALVQYQNYANARLQSVDTAITTNKSNVDSNIARVDTKVDTFKAQTVSNLNSIDSKIDALKSTSNNSVSSVNAALTQFASTTNSNINSVVSLVNSQKANIDSNIGLVNDRVGDAKSLISTVKTSLENDFNTLDGTLQTFTTQFNGSINKLETNATALKSCVSILDADINELRTRTDANTDSIFANISRLDGDLVSTANDVFALNAYTDSSYLSLNGGTITGNLTAGTVSAAFTGNGSRLTNLDANALATGSLRPNIVPASIFNNFGDLNSKWSNFNDPYDFGPRFIQGGFGGPGPDPLQQFYTFFTGLGADYDATQFGLQLAVPRNLPSPYMYARNRENGTWKSWGKISSGTSDTVITPSDFRLKYDNSPIKNALRIVAKLDPEVYRKKNNIQDLPAPTDPIEAGLIYQDILHDVPELRHVLSEPQDDDGIGRIQYVQLIPYLIASINEQQTQIENLTARVTDIEKKS